MSPSKRKPKTALHLLRNLFPTLHFSCSASCRSPPDVDDVIFPYNDVVSSPTFSLNLQSNNFDTPKRYSTCSSSSPRLGESVAAVVKESDDPYLDFRHSMLQMIFENEIFTREDLQELLACFLRLNLPCHHDSIIKAFSEIWGAVMSPAPTHPVKGSMSTSKFGVY